MTHTAYMLSDKMFFQFFFSFYYSTANVYNLRNSQSVVQSMQPGLIPSVRCTCYTLEYTGSRLCLKQTYVDCFCIVHFRVCHLFDDFPLSVLRLCRPIGKAYT